MEQSGPRRNLCRDEQDQVHLVPEQVGDFEHDSGHGGSDKGYEFAVRFVSWIQSEFNFEPETQLAATPFSNYHSHFPFRASADRLEQTSRLNRVKIEIITNILK